MPDLIEVVIDTPKKSRNKYHFEPRKKQFRLKKMLPLGSTFPFDFGFIPKTKGGDGDPIDVLVLSEEASFVGCLIECRIVGVIKAEQKTEKGTERNDRLIGVASASHAFAEIKKLEDLGEKQIAEIEHFFISYNQFEGKEFKPLSRGDAKSAYAIIRKSRRSK